jgi:heterodisulfide reductase subunit B
LALNFTKAISCSGCYQNNNDAEITLNANQSKSESIVYVDEQGTLSLELIEKFLRRD